MSDRFLSFLLYARWASALVALMYHVRFLVLVNYEAVQDKSALLAAFYFLSGLGHEAYAVFFILEGMLAGLILQRARAPAGPGLREAGVYLGTLYRVVLPGLLLGALLDALGAQLFGATGVYTDYPEFSTLSLGFAVLAGNLLMLQPWAVPDFGSNSMLYLSAWLFWCFVLLALVLRLRTRPLQALLVAALVLALPYAFLVWAAIWLAGAGLVLLAGVRPWRPPLLLAAPLFPATLLGSRLLGPATGQVPAPMRDWIIQGGFLLAGLGFAALAWSLYPRGAAAVPAHAEGIIAGARRRPALAASFAFHFHFPVIMLLAAAGAALWELPLKQQPGPVAWAWFACLAGASLATAAFMTWLGAALLARLGGSGGGLAVAGAQVRHPEVDQVQRRAPGDVGD